MHSVAKLQNSFANLIQRAVGPILHVEEEDILRFLLDNDLLLALGQLIELAICFLLLPRLLNH